MRLIIPENTVISRVGLAILLTTFVLAACQDDRSGSAIAPDVSMADGSFIPGLTDRGVSLDMTTDGGGALGDFMDPCQSNDDCLSRWCITVDDRSLCTRTCLRRQDCPGDWECRLIDNTPPDIVSACMPRGDRLCGVCERDTDCPQGHCYELDGESVCGSDCETDMDCPSQFTCEQLEDRLSCVPVTRSCSCNPDADGEARICENGNEFGNCIGRQTCDGAVGWSDCSAQDPAPETCNQVDDDCNGFTDDFVGLGEVCEREATVEGESISCSGRLICTADNPQPVCTATAPTAELCNFLDDDCDGETDEGFEGRGDVCIVGLGTCQQVGINECSQDGTTFQCSVEAAMPGVELCDGLDNDCDGTNDEDFDGLNGICFAGEGACRTAGAVRCAEDQMTAVCSAVARQPVDETCNGIDDDCDGREDEGFEGLFGQCSDGIGACRRLGFLACSEDGAGLSCSAQAAMPGDEVCNGLDDDCDETVDEGFQDVNTACSVGIGACRRAGVTQCNAEGAEVVCSVEAGDPIDETCNGLDDDCDGATDEEYPDLNDACSVGIGSCRVFGITECTADGQDISCDVEPALPAMETCNELDDDCDGTTDESFVGLNTACRVGVGTCQRSGVQRCAADGQSVECDAQAGAPGQELCNRLDDDCDGQSDEDFPRLTDPCSVGVGACLRRGVQRCAANGQETECSAEPGQAVDELCNGVDDDCDGNIDEGYVALGTICSSGVGACLRTGVQICTADGLGTTCSQSAGDPQDEICNGFDDDCDGSNDETHPLIGQICNDGVGLCRRSGVYVCGDDPAGPVECNAEAAPPAATDTCDYQDDDCDSRVDETFVNADGIYAQTDNCGSCGSNCDALWAPNAAEFNVIPRCQIVAGLAQCAFDCIEGSFDADGLSANGCELQPDPNAVYVTTPENGGADVADCGPFGRPCSTLSTGLQRVTALGLPRVLVAEGVYQEAITLVDGVEVLGGHQRTTWTRNPALFPTVLMGNDLEGRLHKATVTARDIEQDTLLDGFVIQGESPLFDGNSYGIYVVDSGPTLRITNNRILAGNGGRGTDGDNGASGQPGTVGITGTAGSNQNQPRNCPNAVINAGGAGGQRVCGGINASGGNGGGARCPQVERQEGSGQSGQAGARGGDGGAGAWGFISPDNLRCFVSGGGPSDAESGEDGANGADSLGGQGAGQGDQGLGNPGAHWQGLFGSSGLAGGPGGGGGGGGAAAGVDTSSWSNRVDVGSSGGGGGSGGCQGLGGQGGLSGGGSFGIYIAFTGAGPRDAAGFPTISDNEITRGLGGNGGAGGNGGGGGEGGLGGAGGPRGVNLLMGFCAYLGGDGGSGGRGGHAGGGGGGGGGISFDIFVSNANGHQPGYGNANVFTRANNEDTAGTGGGGGNSSNTDIGEGQPGQSGRSGHVALSP